MAIAKAQLVPAQADMKDPENQDGSSDTGKTDGGVSSQNGNNSKARTRPIKLPLRAIAPRLRPCPFWQWPRRVFGLPFENITTHKASVFKPFLQNGGPILELARRFVCQDAF